MPERDGGKKPAPTPAKGGPQADAPADWDDDLPEYDGPQKRVRKTPLHRPISTAASERARANFDKVRPDLAKRVGVPAGGQVHHAIELQVLDRYPGTFAEAELNGLANMRGVPPELEKRAQLHQSKIREVWNRYYRGLDAERLKAGTAAYNAMVRNYLSNGRNEIDYVLGQFFSEEGAGRGGAFR
ncbi:MAG: fhaB 9 [Edaphobacter sp.]|nr:fhaB 9 [Edaphobacter sp.]